ncbi:hypothetical protein QVN42_03740 [Yersinia nurmii]|uniref:ATLF-like domain-containing protein n=1 Tax=Yersinia nurmii TaxID=685706 RepID=A0AAW7K579_9GAMM|nr:hypothetical protein [Yersinia nurmii]MDN0086514.1 hypothetical protein [Yersinia nurmii]
MSIISSSTLRRYLNLNLTTKELKTLEKTNLLKVSNVVMTCLNSTLNSTKNTDKINKIQSIVAKINDVRYLAVVDKRRDEVSKELSALMQMKVTLTRLKVIEQEKAAAAADEANKIVAEVREANYRRLIEKIQKKEIIAGFIFASTTPPGMKIDPDPVMVELQKLPLNILKTADTLGQFITLTNDNVTNHPRMNVLKGVTPRGWTNGQTWDSVPGVGASGIGVNNGLDADETVLALTQHANGGWQLSTAHGSANLVLHEYAHAIDRSFAQKANMGDNGFGDVGDSLSRRQSFLDIWQAELGSTPQTDSNYYYWQDGDHGGAEEAFAEAFCDLYGGTSLRPWPNIKAYIAAKMASINPVE